MSFIILVKSAIMLLVSRICYSTYFYTILIKDNSRGFISFVINHFNLIAIINLILRFCSLWSN